MRSALLALILCLAPGLAMAASRTFTYDSDSPAAKSLTGAGLTLTVDQGLLGGVSLKLIQATAVPVAVEVTGVDRKDEAGLRARLPDRAAVGSVYEVVRSVQQGEVLSRAFCPGSTRVWLAASPISYGRSLKLWAVGAGADGAKILCAEMVFAWRGEWRTLPDRKPPAIRGASPSRGF